MLALDDKSKIIKKHKWRKKYVLGCKRSVHPTWEATNNIFTVRIYSKSFPWSVRCVQENISDKH